MICVAFTQRFSPVVIMISPVVNEMHGTKRLRLRLPILVQTEGFGNKQNLIWEFQFYKQTTKPRSKQIFGLTCFANKSFSFIKTIVKPFFMLDKRCTSSEW